MLSTRLPSSGFSSPTMQWRSREDNAFMAAQKKKLFKNLSQESPDEASAHDVLLKDGHLLMGEVVRDDGCYLPVARVLVMPGEGEDLLDTPVDVRGKLPEIVPVEPAHRTAEVARIAEQADVELALPP